MYVTDLIKHDAEGKVDTVVSQAMPWIQLTICTMYKTYLTLGNDKKTSVVNYYSIFCLFAFYMDYILSTILPECSNMNSVADPGFEVRGGPLF